MIFLTGDIHGDLDIRKLSNKNWPESKNLNKTDYLIILGDFGLIWSNPITSEEKYWLEWLNDRPFTTLVVDGNHENHDMLDQLDFTEFAGHKAGIIKENILHLKRGNIYNIDNKKFFVMGGAESHDKPYRVEGKSWWRNEIPSRYEFYYALDNLAIENNEVDYILTHTAPRSIIDIVFSNLQTEGMKKDPTTIFFDEIYKTIKFKKWYCGHFHDDVDYHNVSFLYKKIDQLEHSNE